MCGFQLGQPTQPRCHLGFTHAIVYGQATTSFFFYTKITEPEAEHDILILIINGGAVAESETEWARALGSWTGDRVVLGSNPVSELVLSL